MMGQRGFEPQSKRPKRSRIDQATLLSLSVGLDALMVFNSSSDPDAAKPHGLLPRLIPPDPPHQMDRGDASQKGEKP